MFPLLALLGVVIGAAGIYLARKGQVAIPPTGGGTMPPSPPVAAPDASAPTPAPGATPPPATPPASGGSVAACRAAVPAEKGLVATKAMLGGHIYSGQDPTLVSWLKSYLAQKAEAATGEAKRGILAFAALQGREGSTAAINTYDNQIVTWGTGWGGLGALAMVMDRLVAASPEVVKRLADCGVKYTGKGEWAVDDGTGKIITGKAPALQVIRGTPALLNLLIQLAKDPATRAAVADAQLGAFLASSGKIPGSETIGTQALYNFAAHLKHWAPGYLVPPGKKSAVETAASEVPGEASAERDKQLAPAIVRAYYGNAGPKAYIVPAWKSQLQAYVRDMAKDGLDVTADPTLSASSPPPSNQAVS